MWISRADARGQACRFGQVRESQRRMERSHAGECRRCDMAETDVLAQVAAGLAGFLGFLGLALTGFRAFAGLMLSGLPALTGVACDDGSGRKCARQPGLSWAFFRIMQVVTRSTSGMSELHRRNASPVQACSCSGE